MARKIIVGDQEFIVPDKFPKSGLTIGLILVLLLAIWSSIYRVELEEEGVLMTLGEYSGLVQSGIHVKWPAPIQTVIKIPTKRELEMEFGQAAGSDSRRRSNRSELQEEALMLTGDLNVAVVPWKTQYRIAEPDKFLFKVKDPVGTFRDMNEAVMREVIGDRSVNEVLTTGRQEIAAQMEIKLQEMCDQYENGIKINRILLQKVLPPKQVQDAFNEVNTAEQEKEKMINQALGDYNRIIPRARGEAAKILQAAEAYKKEVVAKAEGEASRFTSIFLEYKNAKEVTQERMYLETMEKVLADIDKVIIEKNAGSGVVPYLPLPELKKGSNN